MIQLLLSFLLLFSCSNSGHILKVAATPVPHAQMLEEIKGDLKKEGIHLKVVVMSDYNLPNRALIDNEVDANFFQHVPFMMQQIKAFDYPIESLAQIHVEPMGVYSKKIRALSSLKNNAVIAIPNDPSNEARALILLHKAGLITLNDVNNLQATKANIIENPKGLQFHEIDAAMLARTLEDVDAAVINTNFALQAKLDPLKDALLLEDKDSPYANVIAIRIDDAGRPDLAILKQWMTSEKMRTFILSKYKGAIIPAF